MNFGFPFVRKKSCSKPAKRRCSRGIAVAVSNIRERIKLKGRTEHGNQRNRNRRHGCQQLIKVLNIAFADEWLAYYQYWLGAKVVKGPMKEAVITELLQHATDELRHSDMIAGRIIQLGGTPVTEPKKWYEVTNCGYDAPNDPFVETILKQNIQGERCAIGFYKRLLESVQES